MHGFRASWRTDAVRFPYDATGTRARLDFPCIAQFLSYSEHMGDARGEARTDGKGKK